MRHVRRELITREDDTEEALAVRLRDYHDQTNPVLAIFRRKEYVYTVDNLLVRPRPAADQGVPRPAAVQGVATRYVQ